MAWGEALSRASPYITNKLFILEICTVFAYGTFYSGMKFLFIQAPIKLAIE
jgi:hypothetical protein